MLKLRICNIALSLSHTHRERERERENVAITTAATAEEVVEVIRA